MSNSLKLLYFGKVAEICGHTTLEHPWVKDLSSFKTSLELQYPLLKTVPYRLAVNKKLTDQNILLQPGDEIALMPPFSGG